MTTQENWKCHGGGSPEREGSLLQQNGEAALRKGPWTKEEDEILLKFVKEKGIVKWTSIGKQTGLARSGKSCRLRWLNHLRPNLKKGSFTKEEENLIVCLHSKYGNKWTRIASKLPGRTDNEIKNFWNTRLKKCQKKQLPIYPETMEDDHSPVVDFNYNFNPNFHSHFLDKSDFNQSLQSRASAPTQTPLSSLHQFSSTLPHSWSIEQLPSPTCPPTQSFTRHFSSHPPSSPHHFLSQNQFSPTHQSTGYFSSMHHSRPASYQSSMPPPPTISSLQKSNMSSLAGHSSICHSTHPLIMPSTCASTPIQYPCMSSLDFGQFRHFKRSGGRLPRPLSAPLMSSTPNSQEPFHSSVSPHNIDTTRTSTGSTFQLNYSSAGPSNCSFIGSPLSVDVTWPSISRGMNDPVSPNSSFTLKAEPPSIQSYPTAPAAQRDPCDTSLLQINPQSMISLDLLNAQLQEDLANRGCQNSRREDLLGQNLNGESLLTESKKTKDSSNNTSRKGNLSSEISKAEIPSDEYSRKDGRLAQSSKTMDSSGSSLNTENSSYKSTRRKEFNTGSNLTGLLIEGSDFMKCLEMEDSLLGKSSIIGCSITKNITTEGESEQESREDLLEEDSGRECLWTDSGYTDELVIGASSCEGDLWNKFSNRDDLADTSASQNINSLTSNSCKQSLLKSQRQNPVLDIDQNSTSFMLEPDGLGSKSSYTKTSAGQKGPIETEDHIDNELSSLLDFFPIASELPEWYNSSQEISSNKATF